MQLNSMAAVDATHIPAAMRARNQWMLWRYEQRGEKRTKPPLQLNGKYAKSNDSRTWCAFDDAMSATGFDGIGFAFAEGDHLVGIDLDHCVEDGVFADWAQEIVAMFPNTYMEYSPSGQGIHIICHGKALATGAKKWVENGQEVGFEIYDYTSPRYFTVTGNAIVPNEVVDCQEQLQRLWDMYFADDEDMPAEQIQQQGGLKLAAPNRIFVENALSNIPADCDYATWIKVGMALKAGGFEMELWDKWSSTAPSKYEPGACAAKWDTLNPQKVTIGSIFYLSNQYAPRPVAPQAAAPQVAAPHQLPAAQSTPDAQPVPNFPPVTNVVPIRQDGNFIEHPKWPNRKVPLQYRLTEGGVFKLSEEKKYGDLFCGPIFVLAETSSPRGEGSAGLVLEMQTRRGGFLSISIPRKRLYEDAKILAQEIADLNVALTPGKEKELLKYLEACSADEQRLSVEQTGWAPASDPEKLVYVLPNNSTEPGYHFQPERYSPSAQSYRESGTLAEWTENVFGMVQDSPYALFAMLASLSAVLLKPAQQDSGGFHFHGISSGGKTTIAQVAASPFGCAADPADAGDSYIRRWNSTTNALEGLAAAHNDSPMILDEMASFGGKDFGKALYDIAGGQGKSAMDASRNLKKQRTWRNLIISTGEVSCRSKIESELPGRRGTAKAGQLLRLIDIEVRPTIFANRSQVDLLKRACSRYYGTLGPAFIRAITAKFSTSQLRDTVQVKLDQAVQRLLRVQAALGQEMNSVQQRAVKRFALAEVAGKMLVSFGLVSGFSDDDVMRAVDTVVTDWAPQSKDIHDSERAINALREFMLANRDARFKRYKMAETSDRMNRELAGYYDANRQLYYVLPATLREATGSEPSIVARILQDRKFLYVEESRSREHLTIRVSAEGVRIRVYAIKQSLLGEPETDTE